MDEISDKLTALLSDPDGMERIRQLAQSLLGEAQAEQEPEAAREGQMAGGDDIGKIMSLLSALKSRDEDSRVQLISALRPHLSTERQARADSAVKLLKLLDMLPLIKESGLLKEIL